jgi:hypothetical protein
MTTLGRQIDQSREEGRRQEQAASAIAPDDNAARLEREFHALTPAGRLRLGWGTGLVGMAQGIEAKRQHLVLHINEILEALECAADPEHAGASPYGQLLRLTGVTGRGRAVSVVAQAERLPMHVVDIEADL